MLFDGFVAALRQFNYDPARAGSWIRDADLSYIGIKLVVKLSTQFARQDTTKVDKETPIVVDCRLSDIPAVSFQILRRQLGNNLRLTVSLTSAPK